MTSIEIKYEKLVNSFQSLFKNIKISLGEQLRQKENLDDNELKIIYTSCLIELYEQALLINDYHVKKINNDVDSKHESLVHNVDKLLDLYESFCLKCSIMSEFTLLPFYLCMGFEKEIWIEFMDIYLEQI